MRHSMVVSPIYIHQRNALYALFTNGNMMVSNVDKPPVHDWITRSASEERAFVHLLAESRGIERFPNEIKEVYEIP